MRSRSASDPSYRQLFGVLARGRRARLAGLGLLLAASSALPLAGPQLLRVFIDEVASGRWSALWWLVGAYLLVSVVQQVVSVGSVYGATHLSWRVTNALRTKVTRHILDLDLSFHDSRTPGEMIERADGDITALSSFVSTFAVQMISSVLTLSGVLVLVLIEDWRVGLGLAGFVAVAGVTLVRLRHAAVPRAAERRAASATLRESLGDNILLGSNPAGASLTAALRTAVLDDDLGSLPDGLDTKIGARGVRLSGGQIQRAAIARALVRHPDLLVLDDVSSALDVETEGRLWDRLLADRRTTLLVVSNRPATLARADQVIELDHGRVRSRGGDVR
ncbi:ABC transporter transmembrane domain-containing protein [Nonomuraea sp. NPDC059023]|uniref:ABC transporter transmembrane domain-containing protein n=1 Tax=unclassified Nonomuraea TaxID=2593643 RepID=UPI00368FCF02